MKKEEKKIVKPFIFALWFLCLLFVVASLSSCNKKYTCTTRTTYKQNPWKSFDEEIQPTTTTFTVSRKEARKLDGQKIEVYGNGLITKSETNCNL